VAACAAGDDPEALVFEATDVLDRLDRLGDLFAVLRVPKTRSRKRS
jgi:hypothetical protein